MYHMDGFIVIQELLIHLVLIFDTCIRHNFLDQAMFLNFNLLSCSVTIDITLII